MLNVFQIELHLLTKIEPTSTRDLPNTCETRPHGETLKIRLAAAPVDGKANECLVDYVADKLGVPRRQVTLVSGLSSRSKKVAVAEISAGQVAGKMLA